MGCCLGLPCAEPAFSLTGGCCRGLSYAKPAFLLTGGCCLGLSCAEPAFSLTGGCCLGLSCAEPAFSLTGGCCRGLVRRTGLLAHGRLLPRSLVRRSLPSCSREAAAEVSRAQNPAFSLTGGCCRGLSCAEPAFLPTGGCCLGLPCAEPAFLLTGGCCLGLSCAEPAFLLTGSCRGRCVRLRHQRLNVRPMAQCLNSGQESVSMMFIGEYFA